MINKSTTSRLNILKGTKINDIDDYLSDNGHLIKASDYFSDYLYKKNIKASDIVKKCQGYISKSYIYDLLNGKKVNPSRDNVILICLASNMNLKETRRTLELFGHRNLYPKDNRDALIAIFINNNIFDIPIINDSLFEHQLPALTED